LYRSTDDFFLMRDPSDNQEYQCVMLECFLYVKVAKMSDAIYKEFYSRFLSGKETLKFQFRKMTVKEFHIPNGGANFTSGELFPDNEVPSKLFFVFVFRESMQGKQTTNPFHFWRKFILTKNVNTIENLTGDIQACYIRENLGEQMAKMKSELANDLKNELRMQFQNMQMFMQGGAVASGNAPGAAPGPSGFAQNGEQQGPPCLPPTPTRTRTRTRVNPPSTSRQQTVLRNSVEEDTGSELSYSDAREEHNSSLQQQQQQQQQHPKRIQDSTEVPVYITSCDVLLNSAVLDQVL
jgi:hypothetical protein